MVQCYNNRAYNLELLPRNAKNANGHQFEVKVNPNGCKLDEIISINLKGQIKVGGGGGCRIDGGSMVAVSHRAEN